MILPDPPKPRLWKALVIVAIPVAFITWFVTPAMHMPTAVAVILAAIVTLGIGGLIHLRVRDDWRAEGTLGVNDFNKRTTVAPNVQVKD